MKNAYKQIAEKLGVEEKIVELCVTDAVNNDLQPINTGKNPSFVDIVVKDIIQFFYCLSLEEQI